MLPRDEELDALVRGASDLGVALARSDASRLIHFLEMLYRWNRTSRLTNVQRHDAVRLHLLDSLSAASLLTSGTAADLGTGAGLPGLPLAVVRPDVRFHLVESNRRRCSFLHEAVREIGLTNAIVVETDVESLARTSQTFNTVISRAFRPPAKFLDLAADLLPIGGRVIVMRGGDSSMPLAVRKSLIALEQDLERRLELPLGGESRSLTVLRRVA